MKNYEKKFKSFIMEEETSGDVYYRIVEQYTIAEATPSVKINIEQLRKCDPPYEGDSDQELADYLSKNVVNFINGEEWAERNKDVYEGAQELVGIQYGDKERIFDSGNKGFNGYVEVGNPDPGHKFGFDSKADSEI